MVSDQNISIGFTENPESQSRALELLVSSLYSDIESSAARELISNAFDANTSVRSEFIEITLPSADLPVFEIRDYGPGLGIEGLKYINKLGESTRRQNEEMTGSFGVGGMTMHNLSDAPILEDIHKGFKRVYQYKQRLSEDGSLLDVKYLALISEEDTNEHSGLKIICSLKPEISVDNLTRGVYERLLGVDKSKYKLVKNNYNFLIVENTLEKLERVKLSTSEITSQVSLVGNTVDNKIDIYRIIDFSNLNLFIKLYGIIYSLETPNQILETKLKEKFRELTKRFYDSGYSLEDLIGSEIPEVNSIGLSDFSEQQARVFFSIISSFKFKARSISWIKEADNAFRKVEFNNIWYSRLEYSQSLILDIPDPRKIKLSTSRESIQTDSDTVNCIYTEVLKFLKQVSLELCDYLHSYTEDTKLLLSRLLFSNENIPYASAYQSNLDLYSIPVRIGNEFYLHKSGVEKYSKQFSNYRLFNNLVTNLFNLSLNSNFYSEIRIFDRLKPTIYHVLLVLLSGNSVLLSPEKPTEKKTMAKFLKQQVPYISWSRLLAIDTHDMPPYIIKSLWLKEYPILDEFEEKIHCLEPKGGHKPLVRIEEEENRNIVASSKPYESLKKSFLSNKGVRVFYLEEKRHCIINYDSYQANNIPLDRLRTTHNLVFVHKDRLPNLTPHAEAIFMASSFINVKDPTVYNNDFVRDSSGKTHWAFVLLSDKPWANFQEYYNSSSNQERMFLWHVEPAIDCLKEVLVKLFNKNYEVFVQALANRPPDNLKIFWDELKPTKSYLISQQAYNYLQQGHLIYQELERIIQKEELQYGKQLLHDNKEIIIKSTEFENVSFFDVVDFFSTTFYKCSFFLSHPLLRELNGFSEYLEWSSDFSYVNSFETCTGIINALSFFPHKKRSFSSILTKSLNNFLVMNVDNLQWQVEDYLISLCSEIKFLNSFESMWNLRIDNSRRESSLIVPSDCIKFVRLLHTIIDVKLQEAES